VPQARPLPGRAAKRARRQTIQETTSIQRLPGNRATTALVQQQRGALLAAAKTVIEQGLEQVPSWPALAAQLLGFAQRESRRPAC
jgi:hypothetical protein